MPAEGFELQTNGLQSGTYLSSPSSPPNRLKYLHASRGGARGRSAAGSVPGLCQQPTWSRADHAASGTMVRERETIVSDFDARVSAT